MHNFDLEQHLDCSFYMSFSNGFLINKRTIEFLLISSPLLGSPGIVIKTNNNGHQGVTIYQPVLKKT